MNNQYIFNKVITVEYQFYVEVWAKDEDSANKIMDKMSYHELVTEELLQNNNAKVDYISHENSNIQSTKTILIKKYE